MTMNDQLYRCIYDLLIDGWAGSATAGFGVQMRKEIMGAKVRIILWPQEALYEIKNDGAIGSDEFRRAKQLVESSGYGRR